MEKVKIAKITLAEDENNHRCSSCTLYVMLFSIIFTINVVIATYFVYSHCYLKTDVTHVKFGTCTETI